MDRLTTEDLFKRFLKDCEARGMSPRSMPGYKSALKMFGLYINQAGVDILKVDREALRGFIVSLKRDRTFPTVHRTNFFRSELVL